MSPHAQNLDDSLFLQHLVHKPVLNVDPPRTGTGQITHQFLKGGWRLERILREDLEQDLSFVFQAGAGKLLRISSCLAGELFSALILSRIT